MRAIVSTSPGGPETLVLQDRHDPHAGPGEVRIRVAAASVNFPDLLIIEDNYQYRPERPFSPGAEISGIVDQIGEGVENIAVGTRVLAMVGWGGMAELVVTPAARVIPIPDAMSFNEAAALVLTYGTSFHALADRARLRPGETLLALRSIAWQGRFLVVGFPAGIAHLPLNLPLLKGCDVLGVFYGSAVERDPQAYRAGVQSLFDHFGRGAIRPHIHAVYPLHEASAALRALASRATAGKIVVSL